MSPPPHELSVVKALFLLLIIFTLTISFTSYKDGDSDTGTSTLNGTWHSEPDGSGVYAVLKLDNGNFELGNSDGIIYEPEAKGTYTINGTKITVKQTQVVQSNGSSWFWVPDDTEAVIEFSINGNKLTLDGEVFTKQ
jgi:hypothetical protein